MSDQTIIFIATAVAVVLIVFALRKRIKRILFPPIGVIETHASDLNGSTVEKIDASGKRVAVNAEGDGSQVRNAKIRPGSEDITISAKTRR